MIDLDTRWKQRLGSYKKALSALTEAVETARLRRLSRLEKQGLIKAFEFTYETAWNLLKDYLEYQGTTGITGSRDAFREALSRDILSDGEDWMAMIPSRNQTSQIYNEETAEEILAVIMKKYHARFIDLETVMRRKADG